MVYPQEGVFRKEVLNAPPCGIGRHGGVRGHGAGGRDQREVRVIGPLLQQHPPWAVDVGHGRVDGRDLAPDGLVILLQGDDFTGVKTSIPYWAWRAWISC